MRSNDTSFQAVTPGGEAVSGSIEGFVTMNPWCSASRNLHIVLQSEEGRDSPFSLLMRTLQKAELA